MIYRDEVECSDKDVSTQGSLYSEMQSSVVFQAYESDLFFQSGDERQRTWCSVGEVLLRMIYSEEAATSSEVLRLEGYLKAWGFNRDCPVNKCCTTVYTLPSKILLHYSRKRLRWWISLQLYRQKQITRKFILWQTNQKKKKNWQRLGRKWGKTQMRNLSD